MVGKRHVTKSMPAPVGGLNVRDAINSMPTKDALTLTNWIPQQYGVRCRKGFREHVIGLGAACKTVLSYRPNREDSSSLRIFAVTDTNIYDATNSTNAPISVFSLVGANDAGRLSNAMFTNTAGSFLLAASFTGGYFVYDGSEWTQKTLGTGVGQIGGIDPDDIVFVTSWKRRAWFVEKDSTNAWYLPTDQITGTAVKFELGPFVKSGGKLSFITSWTIDAGEGIDDLIVFVFEGGDVLIYKGTDPAQATTFSLVGAYYIGSVPVGRRSFSQYGGDVLIISEMGIQPLSYVTRGAQSFLRTEASDYLAKVQSRIAALVSDYSSYNGWDITLFAKENLLVVSVPPGPFGFESQYVMYTNSNSWCLFSGIPMICSAVADDRFWFGTADGRLCEGMTGYFDNVPYGGNTGNGIAGVIQPSYSYFGYPGMNKHFHMIRPTFMSVDQPGVSSAVIVDFKQSEIVGSPITASAEASLWDTARWDASTWAGSFSIFQDWLTVGAVGYAGSAYLVTNCTGDTTLAAIDYIYEPGGVL